MYVFQLSHSTVFHPPPKEKKEKTRTRKKGGVSFTAKIVMKFFNFISKKLDGRLIELAY